MNKQKVNNFAEKFQLLSSQRSTDEINWSSSDSSEFENISTNVSSLINKKSRKRKRKQKVIKNMSHLDITFIDVCKDGKYIAEKNHENSQSFIKDHNTSPILGKSVYFLPYKCKNEPTSPILSSNALIIQQKQKTPLKSPILVLKTTSPHKFSPKVRKKLFNIDSKINNNFVNMLQIRSKSSNSPLNKRKSVYESANKSYNNNLETNEKQYVNAHFKRDCVENAKYLLNEEAVEDIDNLENNENTCTIEETPELDNLDDSDAMIKTSSMELVNKVKNYFDNHFSSSSNTSQLTISETPTQKNSSKTSDDIEITNSITPVVSNRNSSESIKEEINHIDVSKKEKKMRYKKDGLAYRLNNLLKKQVASVSLWQHERFLAENSGFVIPKGEFLAFRICKTHFKYGVCLLEAMDLSDNNFIILINKNYITNESVMSETIFKLYEPYKILDYTSNCKLIINVCKFECLTVLS